LTHHASTHPRPCTRYAGGVEAAMSHALLHRNDATYDARSAADFGESGRGSGTTNLEPSVKCEKCRTVPPAGAKLQTCSGCWTMRYCSSECQRVGGLS